MSNTTITINSSLLPNTITMNQMKPLQVGRIVKCDIPSYAGNIVMRTASIIKFEVMDLSTFKKSSCWSDTQDTKSIIVELLDAELVVNIK